jgi:hypothetical protein
VVVVLCIEAAMESHVSCLPRNICYRWCLVVTEVVVTDAQVGDDASVSAFAMAEAIVAEALALALANEGYLWIVAALLALLFLARYVTT